MEPTLEAVKEALSIQGILLGLHDELLTGIMKSLQDLHLQITHLTGQIPTGNNQVSGPSTPPAGGSSSDQSPSSAPAGAVREPFVPSPKPFSGDLGSCAQFILNCSLVFDLQPSSYPSDKT